MIGFILFSIALLVMVMWLIAPALLGKQEQIIDSTKQTNISIAREKLAELETQLAQGDITQAQYDQSHDEIEFALLDDTDSDDTDTGETTVGELPVSYRRNIFVLLTAIPFIAFGLYQYWGEPDAITGIAATQGNIQTGQGQQTAPEHSINMEEALVLLEAKLEKNPDNPDAWYTLARTYMVQKQYKNAARAFRRLQALVGDDHAAILLGLADALTMSRNGDMRGEPFELAKRALKLEPNNTTALWLTGLGHQDNGDLKSALGMWKKLLPLLTEDPRSAHQIKTLIDQANRQLGIAVTDTPRTPPKPVETTAASKAGLTVQVKLDPALRAKVSDADYVMVYAQRVEGMKMPLAMIRLQIKDLPTTIKLDDSTSLSPVNKLSGEQQVYVVARISKSSQAAKQAGDIETKMGPYPVAGSAPVTIILGL